MAAASGSRAVLWLSAALLLTAGLWGHAARAAEEEKPPPKARSFSDLLKDLEKAGEEDQPPTPPAPKQPPEQPPPTPEPPPEKAVEPPAAAPADTGRQTSDDPSFGTTASNPVKLGLPADQGRAGSALLSGVKAERLFLRRLRDRKLRPFRFRRLGSVDGEDGHPVDRFELTDGDGKRRILYLDMYHPETPPSEAKAPKGTRLWQAAAEEPDTR